MKEVVKTKGADEITECGLQSKEATLTSYFNSITVHWAPDVDQALLQAMQTEQ